MHNKDKAQQPSRSHSSQLYQSVAADPTQCRRIDPRTLTLRLGAPAAPGLRSCRAGRWQRSSPRSWPSTSSPTGSGPSRRMRGGDPQNPAVGARMISRIRSQLRLVQVAKGGRWCARSLRASRRRARTENSRPILAACSTCSLYPSASCPSSSPPSRDSPSSACSARSGARHYTEARDQLSGC